MMAASRFWGRSVPATRGFFRTDLNAKYRSFVISQFMNTHSSPESALSPQGERAWLFCRLFLLGMAYLCMDVLNDGESFRGQLLLMGWCFTPFLTGWAFYGKPPGKVHVAGTGVGGLKWPAAFVSLLMLMCLGVAAAASFRMGISGFGLVLLIVAVLPGVAVLRAVSALKHREPLKDEDSERMASLFLRWPGLWHVLAVSVLTLPYFALMYLQMATIAIGPKYEPGIRLLKPFSPMWIVFGAMLLGAMPFRWSVQVARNICRIAILLTGLMCLLVLNWIPALLVRLIGEISGYRPEMGLADTVWHSLTVPQFGWSSLAIGWGALMWLWLVKDFCQDIDE